MSKNVLVKSKIFLIGAIALFVVLLVKLRLGTKYLVVGDLGSDRFFVGFGGDNTIISGADSERFWIFSAEIPESANTSLFRQETF